MSVPADSVTELLFERQVVAADVQQAVEQCRAVPGRKHEAVAIGPERVRGVVLELLRPQGIGHRRGAERQPRMAAVRLLHHVDGEKVQGIDALLVERVGHDRSFGVH